MTSDDDDRDALFLQNIWLTEDKNVDPLSANPTKWSGPLKQIFWVCLTVLWGWRLKG